MSADVVIVGAGVVGCATAYYLARAGAQVTIVERDSVGSHASGFALGGLNPLSGVGIPDPLGPLALEGFRLHLALATALREETGIDVELRMHSALTLALTEADAVAMKHRLPRQQAQEDFSVAWWSAKEILKMEPRLTPRVVGGVVIRQVGLLDSSTYCLALLEAATRRGATVRTGASDVGADVQAEPPTARSATLVTTAARRFAAERRERRPRTRPDRRGRTLARAGAVGVFMAFGLCLPRKAPEPFRARKGYADSSETHLHTAFSADLACLRAGLSGLNAPSPRQDGTGSAGEGKASRG